MSSLLNDTLGDAKNTMYSASATTHDAFVKGHSALIDGLHSLSSAIQVLRGLQLGDALGLVGLTRRRGPLGSLALFGAGVVVGAGAGMLFAPMSGADARRTLFGRAKGLEKDVERGLETAKNAAKDMEGKAEDAALKAKDAVEQKVEDVTDKAKDFALKAKDAVEQKVEDVTDKAKDTFARTERRLEGRAQENKPADTSKNGVGNPARQH